jgi:hypothetical protein
MLDTCFEYRFLHKSVIGSVAKQSLVFNRTVMLCNTKEYHVAIKINLF